MATEIWLVIRDGKQLEGQHSDEQVQALLQAHSSSTFFVWKSGMDEWVDPRSLEQFRGAAPPPPPAAPQPPPSGAAQHLKKISRSRDPHFYLPHLKLLDAILGWFAKLLSAQRLGNIDEAAKKIGHVSLILSALLIFLFGVIFAIRSSDASAFFTYLLVFPVLLIAQYVAVKFLDAGGQLIAKTPSSLSSRAVPECFALLALIAVIVALVGGFVGSITEGSAVPFGTGLGASLILLYMLGAALNASTLNIDVEGGASAGEEAIGILAFLLKLNLRLVPFVFGVGSALGTLGVLYTLVLIIRAHQLTLGLALFEATNVFMFVMVVAVSPFLIYLGFVVYYLLLDVLRAVLCVPAKLDRLSPPEGDQAEQQEQPSTP